MKHHVVAAVLVALFIATDGAVEQRLYFATEGVAD